MWFLRVTHTLSPPMASTLKAFWHSPVGPKTVHFWGPAANWGLVLAAMIDMSKPADTISLKVCAYGNNSSALIARLPGAGAALRAAAVIGRVDSTLTTVAVGRADATPIAASVGSAGAVLRRGADLNQSRSGCEP